MDELDFSEQIAALRSTFADIRAVVGVDKLTAETPMFVIESDATIVVPLVLGALLECKQDPKAANALLGGL